MKSPRYLRVALPAALCAFAGACADEAAAPPPATPSPAPASSAASAAPAAAEPVPALRLPGDTRPTAEAIELVVDPAQDRFSGTVTIDVTLDHPRQTIWLHGRDMAVSSASVTPEGGAPIAATWKQASDVGMASLTLASPAPSGKARIAIAYDAPFSKGLNGLYKMVQAGVPYAFTQFESTDARRAFPCFDEPGFKIPFTESLVVPREVQAITNTPEVSRAAAPGAAGKIRVAFATTKPLPTYLVAFAVGPLDIVKAADVPPTAARSKPLPLRMITTRGNGPALAYAARHAGEIVSVLETYFGVAYPYDKLDMLAVPDREGAMENAGAIMYRDDALLIDEKTAPIEQLEEFAYVVAHETAHQWFGDLVTMAWWDDLWLNESFATWMGYKAVDLWNPRLDGRMRLLGEVQGSIGQDALATARKIRQPILAHTDIESAFDGITYGKGAAVLSMFERWVGPDAFQHGVHDYLAQHAFGSATADDFLASLSAAAGKDVGTPFRTFLDQPGVPFLDASVACDGGSARLHVKQSRYFPVGSTGDPAHTWQIPVCARYGVKGKVLESCGLVTAAEGDVALDACPEWITPNAEAAGYYRFGLPKDELRKLSTKGLASLTTPEKVAYGNALRAQLNRATTPLGDLLDVSAPLARDPNPQIAGEAMGLGGQADEWLREDPLHTKVEAYERGLFAATGKALGWDAKKGESTDRTKLRGRVLGHLAFTARDPVVRAEARKRALAYLGKDEAVHPDALAPELVGTALAVAAQDGDAATFDALLARLRKTEDPIRRGRLLGALSSVEDPSRSARARDLALSDALRLSERLEPLFTQVFDPVTREATWTWLQKHFDEMLPMLRSLTFAGGGAISLFEAFCDGKRADEVQAFLAPRASAIEGGERAAAHAVEEIRLCTAKRAIQEPSARAFFAKK